MSTFVDYDGQNPVNLDLIYTIRLSGKIIKFFTSDSETFIRWVFETEKEAASAYHEITNLSGLVIYIGD